MDFLPCEEAPDHTFDTFTCFEAEKKDLIKTDITKSRMWFHINGVICNGNRDSLNYLMKWFAKLFQSPLQKAGTAFVLRSGQGAGKDTLMDFRGRLLFRGLRPEAGNAGSRGDLSHILLEVLATLLQLRSAHVCPPKPSPKA